MGCYIEGPTLGKADHIIKNHGGEEINRPLFFEEVDKDKAIICVVFNGPFDAAGFCFNAREFEVFSHPDTRPKRWVLIDRELACELTGYKENEHLDVM